jgi:hypothetical protein
VPRRRDALRVAAVIVHFVGANGVTLVRDTTPTVLHARPGQCPYIRMRAGSVWPVYMTGAGELERARWSPWPLHCRRSERDA